jgi:hypothetical protein
MTWSGARAPDVFGRSTPGGVRPRHEPRGGPCGGRGMRLRGGADVLGCR